MSLATHWQAAHAGRPVRFRPRGSSMAGLVPDRALVDLVPADGRDLAVGDVVLVRVRGTVYLHKVIGLDPAGGRVRIGNNRGGVNGWARRDAVAGLATHVDGRPLPAAGR